MANFGSAGRNRALRLVATAAGVLALATAALAQDAARAARLSNVDGPVQLSQGSTVLAAPALANTPLFEGTRIATAQEGRAEVQFDDGSIVRVTPNSSLTLSVMRQQDGSPVTEVVLDSGLAYFELQGTSSGGRFGVHFGTDTVTASGFTVLRVDLDNPPGALAVFSGNAHLDGAAGLALDLHGGESAVLNATDAAAYQLAESIEPDSWDAWNSDRDQALTAEEAQRTVATDNLPNANNPAWSDLDANGNWYNVPGQGYVWSPYEAQSAGWDPYGCGSWVATPGFGYQWVSCESWGFMPYGSGLWSYYDGFGWGWEPGGGYWYGGGLGTNIGSTPFRYRPPQRPRGGPVSPRQIPPTVAVNRFHGGSNLAGSNGAGSNGAGSNGAIGQTIRPRGGPVVIAGSTVQPLRPVGTRTVYNHEATVTVGGGTRETARASAPGNAPSSGFVGHGATGVNAGARPAYVEPAPGSYSSGYRSGVYGGNGDHPPSHYGGYEGRAPAPASHPNSGGGSAPRASGGGGAPSAPHYSGGGGGGGGASHGGGGGGGGGAHH